MNILFVGGLNKFGINYLNFYVQKTKNRIYCIDKNTSYINYLKVTEHIGDSVILFYEEIEVNNIRKILEKNKIDLVLNFYDLNSPNLEYDEYDKHNVTFIKDLTKLLNEFSVKKMIYISTVDVYGNSRNLACDEKTLVMETSYYTKSKIEAEKYLLNQGNIEVLILRVAHLFGIVTTNDNFIDNIVLSYVNDKELCIEEQSDFYFNYLDVDDAIYFLNFFIDSTITGIVNLASNTNFFAKKIIEIACKEFDIDENSVVYTNTKIPKLKYMNINNNYLKSLCSYELNQQEEKLSYYFKRIKHYKKTIKYYF